MVIVFAPRETYTGTCPGLNSRINQHCGEQVLAEAKEAKEAAFQAQWKQMKTGAQRGMA